MADDDSTISSTNPTTTAVKSEGSSSLTRRPSQETLASSQSHVSEASSDDAQAQAQAVPAAPPPSVASTLSDNQHILNAISTNLARLSIAGSAQLLAALNALGEAAPAAEPGPDEGKARLRGPMRYDLPLLNQLFKAPPPQPRRSVRRKRSRVTFRRVLGNSSSTATPTATKGKSDISPPNEHVHEHTTWIDYAIEDVDHSLKRLVMAGKDLHRLDNSKTETEHYSEKLAELIQKQEFKFDPAALK